MPPTGAGDTAHLERASADDTEDTPKVPWRALFFFTTKSNIPLLVFAITISVVSGALDPAKSYLIGKAFGGFTSYATGNLHADEFLYLEKKYVYYLLIVAGGAWLCSFLELTCWLAFGELQAKSSRDRLFHGLLQKEIEWYDLRKNGIGALLPRIQAQIRELQLATSQPLGLSINLISTAILSLIQALVRAWDLTLVSLASAPIIMVAVVLVGRNLSKDLEKQQAKLSEAQKSSTSALSAIETVKCFNGQETERHKYVECITEGARHYYRVASANALQMAFIVLLSVSMFVQGFYYGGVLIREGKKNSSDVITTFFSAISAFQSITTIIPQMIVLEKGKIAGSTLRMIMAQVQHNSSNRQSMGSMAPRSYEGNIDIKNVSFAYPSRPQQLALDNVTLYIPGGDLTFLIGTSGSGKSTLGQLLMRFYSADHGQIALDGVALDAFNEKWLRSHVTLVEQTSTLFDDTVFQNIAFGKSGHNAVIKEEVADAAQFALLQLMINDMPNGWETVVGSKGNALSGGQTQRMALARARLRDTPILLLDESTSALDQISRALMMDAIRQWRRGKTTIVITHDISQILPDDYAYVLEHGRLVQEGYRKHMEKAKDSPFQRFLPQGLRAEVSPYDQRKTTAFESIRTRGSSLDITLDGPSGVTTDLLEEQLKASENERKSVLPKVFQSGSPLLGVRTRAHAVTTSAFASPWMRLAASARSESPSSPSSSRRSGLWSINEEALSPAMRDESRRSQRVSQLMEKFMDRTGQLAAESRMRPVGVERRPIKQTELDVSSESTPELHGTNLDEEQIGKTLVRKSFKEIMETLWPSIDRPTRLILIFGFWGATVHAIAQPVFSYVLSKLLQTYATPEGQRHKALTYSMIILALAVIDSVHVYIDRFCLEYVGQRWVDNIRAEAMKRVLDQPREFFDKDENAVSRVTGSLDRNAEEMRNLLGRFSGLIWIATLMVIISIVWATIAQWKMTLISLSIVPYIYMVTKAFMMVSEEWESHSNSAAEDAAAIFTEVFTNIKTVRALTLEQHFTDKYVRTTNHVLHIGFQRSLFSGFFFGLSDSAGYFSTALIFYIGAVLVKSGAPVQHIVQVFTMLIFAVTNLGAILEYVPQIGSSKDTAGRLLRLAQLPGDSHEHGGDIRITAVGDIVFDDLHFAYLSRPEHTILHYLNLRISSGSCTAIVGGSGSGKSTIANLLLKLYSTSPRPVIGNGQIGDADLVLGGRDVKRIYTPSLRSFVVTVSQTPVIFSATVADNISYGLPPHSQYNSMARITMAAKDAGVHDFISSLPQGYDTPVGDGGMGVSGGQAQRIAIARALIRKPAVLILDEATSALDVESADLMRHTLEKLVADRSRAMTVIIITHSKEMMEIAENVVVLDKGMVVEQGGFDELLAKNGALTNLLNGGEWTNGETQRATVRPKGVPRLKDVDWRRRTKSRRPC